MNNGGALLIFHGGPRPAVGSAHDRSWATRSDGMDRELVQEGYSVSSARSRPLQTKLLHPAAQCAGRNPQANGRTIGTFDVPVCQREGLQNVPLFEIFEAGGWQHHGGGALRTQDMFVDTQDRVTRKNHRSLNHVFQFTDIAGPG